MSKKEKNIDETIFQIFIGAIAILAIKAIFSNDNSKIISSKGKRTLNDDEKIFELQNKLKEIEKKSKENNEYEDTFEEVYL